MLPFEGYRLKGSRIGQWNGNKKGWKKKKERERIKIHWLSGKRKVKVLVAQSCSTVCDPMDCSPPGSSVHGILQASIL